jgi:GNAT superfamily N-acetyltransferase
MSDVPLRPEIRISLDPSLLDLAAIHAFLTTSYWSPGIPLETVEVAAKNSLTIGAFLQTGEQIGFARLVTDHATFGYLADVYVLEAHRGRGIASRMVSELLNLPEVLKFRRLLLATRDAHQVYARLGFESVQDPKPFMQIVRKDIYLDPSERSAP